DQHLQFVIDGYGLRHGEDEGGLAHAPLGIHYGDAVAHRVLQPPKAEATSAPHIDNGATKENLWRTAETCLDRRSSVHWPPRLGRSRRKCTSNPTRTNQLVCAHTAPRVARARMTQLWRTAASGVEPI